VFDVDNLIDECREARSEADPHRAVREVLERTVADAGGVGDALQPRRGGMQILHAAPDLTIIHFVWAPKMKLFPHDHRMAAVIGMYEGQEDNTFYRRSPDQPTTVTATTGKEVRAGDVLTLGKDVIHGVVNPLDRLTAAIHVYLGDYVNEPRSQWGPGPLEERPFDVDAIRERFEEANAEAGLTA
jgi:predicted metal-dependent enzyme (double-stranded beta helix superfamily)